MYKVFIDGSAGTTGLKIVDRLSKRKDLSLILLDEKFRKDVNARKDAINSSDVTFLCLPDVASIEAVSLVENDKVKIIDTSTAFRTDDNWEYGFAELQGRRDKIKVSKRIANPGCHASGFIALVEPLISNGILKKDAFLTCFSLTGYTGGGKKMIAEYESEDVLQSYLAPRQYGLGQTHKHIPEMVKVCKMDNKPIFCPIVANFDRGMEVTVPLFSKDINGNINDIKEVYRQLYNGKIVHYDENADENGFASANAFKGKDDMQISVFGNEERILLVSRFDNLGKGASGAAIQNMNILLGEDECTGLEL